jgi:hypothetical protein
MMAFLDKASDKRRQGAAIGDVDSERSLEDEVSQSPRTVAY